MSISVRVPSFEFTRGYTIIRSHYFYISLIILSLSAMTDPELGIDEYIINSVEIANRDIDLDDCQI